MKSAKLYRYQLPMDSGVVLRNHKLTERVGFIVELTENGRVGRGEISPLIGFSVETTEEAGLQAQKQLELWVAGQNADYDELYPSVAFGLSMAELELAGELPKEGNYRSAPLCSGDPDEVLPVLSAMEGKKVAKVKVGLYEPIRDGMIVSLLLESIPDLSLRLDANRSWSLEKAHKFAKYIAPSLRQRIHYLEEPCLVPGDSFSFAIDSGIAIAWDETLQHAIQKRDFCLEDLTGAKAIVIKPTLIGSVTRCINLIEKANTLGIQAVISSSIESSLGLDQLARLSLWLLPDEVPGLDTLNLFQCQLETAWPGSTLPIYKLSDQQVMWQS
ncbi:o-succinylbenzoate synthase [Vibrio genomosp. F10 str. 9ZC157]|uniref:o-succinylbenzoate synthase n=1 Tax=Vibrio genomosp. F10 str. ZF-129 TaxID=1187848 RepID=A0A1E5BI57_9VIBR|nr:o-succinylbenzoate synthase [Vibrio genomosp. F10]OEE36963.1 o-succinylbenzoate synthase [Vibrio genomosp. F10 str. ZF-129]OEE95971.1 o-succinylbenzoate synthase [Vibrio genomosp. F10 str. 9ZC157]